MDTTSDDLIASYVGQEVELPVLAGGKAYEVFLDNKKFLVVNFGRHNIATSTILRWAAHSRLEPCSEKVYRKFKARLPNFNETINIFGLMVSCLLTTAQCGRCAIAYGGDWKSWDSENFPIRSEETWHYEHWFLFRELKPPT